MLHNIFAIANLDQFDNGFENFRIRAEITFKKRNNFQHKVRNWEGSLVDVAVLKHQIDRIDELVQSSIIMLKALSRNESPQYVDIRQIETIPKINDPIGVSCRFFFDFFFQFKDFFNYQIFGSCSTESQVSQMSESKPALLTPQFSIQPSNSYTINQLYNHIKHDGWFLVYLFQDQKSFREWKVYPLFRSGHYCVELHELLRDR